jgi:alpha-tubulin suppressor-like RCC1 family protein
VRWVCGLLAIASLVLCGSSTGTSIVPSVAAGFTHTCATTTQLRCWGDNRDGEVGDGTNTGRLTPTQVSGLTNGVIVADGSSFQTCALVGGGGLMCWGGIVGDGTETAHSTPTTVPGLTGVTAVALGIGHICALAGGGIQCWGSDRHGELGDGATAFRRLSPIAVQGLGQGAHAVAAGDGYTCALVGVSVECWGSNTSGELGDRDCRLDCLEPADVPGLDGGVDAIAAGGSHTCALIDGGVKCWGDNESGELGDGTTKNRPQPVSVKGLPSGVREISLGFLHSCALLDSGAVKCWGSNSYGELGDGTRVDRHVPVTVRGLSGVQQISAGGSHTCAITSGGTPLCWGSNRFGQLGNGTHTWDVDIFITGRGTLSLPGFRCRSARVRGDDCFTEYAPNTKLVVRAQAAGGWKFKRWAGACKGKKPRCVTRVTSNKSVRAAFGRT